MIDPEDLEGALVAGDDRPPRPSLVADVLHRVRVEAASPPPLQLPWCRILVAAAVPLLAGTAALSVPVDLQPLAIEVAQALLWGGLAAVATGLVAGVAADAR